MNKTRKERDLWNVRLMFPVGYGTMRFFADDGAAGGGGSDTTDLSSDTNSDTGDDIQDAPWYDGIEGLDDGGRKILDKYKTQEDAIKSIPHRERRLGDLKIDFPDEKASPEDREKQHRLILRRMGLPKESDAYKETAAKLMKDLAPDVKKAISEDVVAQTCQEAVELGLLPWQFEKLFAEKLANTVQQVENGQDTSVAAQNKLEKAMKLRYKLQHGDHVQNAELMAAHLDDFIRENPHGLEGENGKIAKDAVSQLLKGQSNPVLYAVFDYLHDLILSEGDGSGTRRFGAPANDVYTNAYNTAKTQWPNRGEDYWKGYANDVARGA